MHKKTCDKKLKTGTNQAQIKALFLQPRADAPASRNTGAFKTGFPRRPWEPELLLHPTQFKKNHDDLFKSRVENNDENCKDST